MLFDIDFCYSQWYLPTKRHRKVRYRDVKDVVSAGIAELQEKDFPIAFIVHDYRSVYDNAQCYEDFKGTGDFRIFPEEIRYYGGKFFKVMRFSCGTAVSSTKYAPLDTVRMRLKNVSPFTTDENFNESSVVLGDSRAACIKGIIEKTRNYVIYDGKLWEVCGEPVYKVVTFGMGNNHGGTALFIEHDFSPANREYIFSALERDLAIEHGTQTALNRGDTDSVERMGNKNIEVLMPDVVTKIVRKKEDEIIRNPMYRKLKPHIGHQIVCVAYGDGNNPKDICIECEDCCEVLVSSEDFEDEPENAERKFVVATFDSENKVRTAIFKGNCEEDILSKQEVLNFINGNEYAIEAYE